MAPPEEHTAATADVRGAAGRLLDEQLLRAVERRCAHPLRVPRVADDRFGEGCAQCLALVHDLAAIVDDTAAELARRAEARR